MNDWIDVAGDIFIVAILALITGGDVVMGITNDGIMMGVI